MQTQTTTAMVHKFGSKHGPVLLNLSYIPYGPRIKYQHTIALGLIRGLIIGDPTNESSLKLRIFTKHGRNDPWVDINLIIYMVPVFCISISQELKLKIHSGNF